MKIKTKLFVWGIALALIMLLVPRLAVVLGGENGIEMEYKFDFSTEFEHLIADDGGRNSARINLQIELTSPLGQEISDSDDEISERYLEAYNRISVINSSFCICSSAIRS